MMGRDEDKAPRVASCPRCGDEHIHFPDFDCDDLCEACFAVERERDDAIQDILGGMVAAADRRAEAIDNDDYQAMAARAERIVDSGVWT